jgi:ABC-type iron transport system FetAB permease component
MSRTTFIKSAKPIVTVSLVLLSAHLILLQFALPEIYRQSKFWAIYLFLVPMTLGAIYIIVKEKNKNANSVGKNFFVYMAIKMLLILLFLSPWLVYQNEFSRPIVYQFFAIFFPLLFVETIVLVRLVNPKK